MIMYKKENPRIIVQFIDSDTKNVLFEIKDRNWMNVGELFTDNIASSIMRTEFSGKEEKMPENFYIIIAEEFKSCGE